METKIIFNGKTYTSVASMPDEVRQAYQQAMAQFADADKNGIPDILERGAKGNVIAIQQSSTSFNGRKFKSVVRCLPLCVAFSNWRWARQMQTKTAFRTRWNLHWAYRLHHPLPEASGPRLPPPGIEQWPTRRPSAKTSRRDSAEPLTRWKPFFGYFSASSRSPR